MKKRNEIREVFGKGKRIGCIEAKLFVLKNNLPYNRICFSFSKGFGSAVERNRARRLGREAYRNLKSSLRGGYDLVLLTYRTSANASANANAHATFSGRIGQLQHLFSRAGLLA